MLVCGACVVLGLCCYVVLMCCRMCVVLSFAAFEYVVYLCCVFCWSGLVV